MTFRAAAERPKAWISVLIAAYNVESVLEGAVASALAQTHHHLEIIVVDDASDDATWDVIQSLASRDDRVRGLRMHRNMGPGAARTRGLRAAVGEWIAILDADDRLHPDRLKRLIVAAELDHLDAIADNVKLVDPGLETCVGHAFPLADEERFALTPLNFVANGVPGGRINLGWLKPMVRRRFLEEYGVSWRPLRHAEDFLFAMELLLAGARFELIGWPGYRYTQRRGARSGERSAHSRTTRSAAEQQRAVDILLNEHGSKLSPALRAALIARLPEIEVTAAVLDALDAVRDRRPSDAIRASAAAISRPRALARCLDARFGPRSRRLVP